MSRFFCSVPRLYNRIYERITGGVDAKGGIAKALFNMALDAKKANLNSSNIMTHSLWDRLVFRAVAERVGLDRCKLMLTGSAPIAPHVCTSHGRAPRGGGGARTKCDAMIRS